MSKQIFIVVTLLFGQHLWAQQITLDLMDVIELAREQSTFSRSAETRKQNSYWVYKTYRANYNPSLSLMGNLPGYRRDFIENRQDNGEIQYQGLQQVSSSLRLGLIQPISLTGGRVSVNGGMRQFENLNTDFTQYNSTLINIDFQQPLFGFNDLRWDKKIEPLRYEESKRSYVEEMELLSREVVERYFQFLRAQISQEIASLNLVNNEKNYEIEQGRYNIGKVSKADLLELELQVLRSKQDLTRANLNQKSSRLGLITYIGLQDSSGVQLSLTAPDLLPDFEIDLDEALLYAERNRSDYLMLERRMIEARRDVARAKAARNSVSLNASFGLNKAGETFEESYTDPNSQQLLNLSLDIPIVDWGRSNARTQSALASQRLTEYTNNQELQNFEQEIITLVGQFEVLRANVLLASKADEVASERYEVAQNRYLIGKTSVTDLNLAQSQKDEAKMDYISALEQFWTSYFDLRRLTLYDFLHGELLYQEYD